MLFKYDSNVKNSLVSVSLPINIINFKQQKAMKYYIVNESDLRFSVGIQSDA